MPGRLACPSCHAQWAVPENTARHPGRCPRCGTLLRETTTAPHENFDDLDVVADQSAEQFDDLEVVADHRPRNFLPASDAYRGIRLLQPLHFAIKAQSGFFNRTLAYDIFDADTREWLGQVNENAGSPVLQWLLPRRWFSTQIDVRQGREQALVFSVRRPGYMYSTRVQIVDTRGQLVGSFQSKAFAMFYGGFPLCDPNGRPVANVILQRNPSRLVFLTSGGQQLGEVVNDAWGKWQFMGLKRGADYHVDVEPELADQPLAKLLLLATAFAVDLLWQDTLRDARRGPSFPTGAGS
jgi:hypothetical protein